jgi:rRNA maturation endonuclease Nob1
VIDLADAHAAIVPLAKAQLCVDCEAIGDAPEGCCRACGSRSLLSLKTVLDRETAVES